MQRAVLFLSSQIIHEAFRMSGVAFILVPRAQLVGPPGVAGFLSPEIMPSTKHAHSQAPDDALKATLLPLTELNQDLHMTFKRT